MDSLSARIKAALTKSQHNQVELAKACGITPTSVNNWISGETKSMKAETAIKAAAFLKVNVNWLANGIGPMGLDSPAEETKTLYAHFSLDDLYVKKRDYVRLRTEEMESCGIQDPLRITSSNKKCSRALLHVNARIEEINEQIHVLLAAQQRDSNTEPAKSSLPNELLESVVASIELEELANSAIGFATLAYDEFSSLDGAHIKGVRQAEYEKSPVDYEAQIRQAHELREKCAEVLKSEGVVTIPPRLKSIIASLLENKEDSELIESIERIIRLGDRNKQGISNSKGRNSDKSHDGYVLPGVKSEDGDPERAEPKGKNKKRSNG